jgi:hypothetical protein
MAVLLSPFSPELLSPFSSELGYLLLPHLLLPPFSPEVEPEPATPRLAARRRRWLAGSDTEPPEPRRVAAETAERARNLVLGVGGADAGEKKLP